MSKPGHSQPAAETPHSRIGRGASGRVAIITVAVALVAALTASPAQAQGSSYARVSQVGSILLITEPVPLVGSGDLVLPMVSTEVVLTKRTVAVSYASRTLFEGQVITFDGALPKATVRLYAQPVGQKHRDLVATALTSKSRGIFRFDTNKPARKTSYTVEYVSKYVYASSKVSATVEVYRKITSQMAQNSDGTLTMRGSIAPKSPRKTVHLQRKTCASCSWSTIESRTASSDSKYAFRFSGPPRGTWYFRVVTPSDDGFRTSTSATWAVRR